MKILICGNRGQLGRDCTRVLQKKHELTGVDLQELDICRPADVDGFVQQSAPDIIVNCAAYTQVDKCETERELAWKANVTGPENLAVRAQKYGARLIHISTDYVFSGKKKVPEPYVEDDATDPLSYYGLTKLESEKVVKKATDNHVILRTAWLHGVTGHNFLKTMQKLALENPERELKVVNDQYGSPTLSFRLALQIEKVIEAGSVGTYHATSEGYCTWYELAKYFLDEMEIPNEIIPCTTAEYPTPAARPLNSILENRNLKQTGINVMPLWQDEVKHLVDTYKKQLANLTI